MKRSKGLWLLAAGITLHIAIALSHAAAAASFELKNDPATGGPGKFAADEIRREALSKARHQV
jgi:hypothetical protein